MGWGQGWGLCQPGVGLILLTLGERGLCRHHLEAVQEVFTLEETRRGWGVSGGAGSTLPPPRAVAPHLPPQHQQPRVGVEQRDHGPAKGRRALSTAGRGSAPCPGTWQRPNSHGARSCPLSPFPRCSPKPQDHGRWAHAGGFPAVPTAPGHCRVPSVRRMGTALSISPIYSLPWHGPAPLSPAVTALWPRDLGAWHGSAGTGHMDAKCG